MAFIILFFFFSQYTVMSTRVPAKAGTTVRGEGTVLLGMGLLGMNRFLTIILLLLVGCCSSEPPGSWSVRLPASVVLLSAAYGSREVETYQHLLFFLPPFSSPSSPTTPRCPPKTPPPCTPKRSRPAPSAHPKTPSPRPHRLFSPCVETAADELHESKIKNLEP